MFWTKIRPRFAHITGAASPPGRTTRRPRQQCAPWSQPVHFRGLRRSRASDRPASLACSGRVAISVFTSGRGLQTGTEESPDKLELKDFEAIWALSCPDFTKVLPPHRRRRLRTVARGNLTDVTDFRPNRKTSPAFRSLRSLCQSWSRRDRASARQVGFWASATRFKTGQTGAPYLPFSPMASTISLSRLSSRSGAGGSGGFGAAVCGALAGAMMMSITT